MARARKSVPDDWPREGAWLVVRLTGHIGGTRNGQEWPAAGSLVLLPLLEAADMLAQHLVAAHLETVDDPGQVVVIR